MDVDSVLRMANAGAVTQLSLAIVIQPGRDWSGLGYSYARALLEAWRAGYFERPM